MQSDFVCKCEGDLERISSVFLGWLKNNDVNTEKQYTISVPNEWWANLFVDVYTDSIHNYGLAEEAEATIINITFQVENSILESDADWEKLKDLTDDELFEALEELMDDLDDNVEDDEDDKDEEDA